MASRDATAALGGVAWGDVPSWLSALATAAALVAAVKAWRAAAAVVMIERQRDADRADTEQRQQADRVATWPSLVLSDPSDPRSPPRWGVAVRNASGLPIYQVHIEHEPITRHAGALAVIFEVVPPGTFLLSERRLYRLSRADRLLRVGVDEALPDRGYQVALTFTDAAGRTWHRDVRGALSRR